MRATSISRLAAALGVMLLGAVQAQIPAPAAPPPTSDTRFERVAEVVQQKMKELSVPGVALGILSEGEVRTRAFGVTNVDHPLPVTDDTLFQIGSISKTFTGTAIMRLVEQNKLQPRRSHSQAPAGIQGQRRRRVGTGHRSRHADAHGRLGRRLLRRPVER